ncbi:MAG: hypothetical protein MI866_14245 [Bacteroidales bacterium]|nr:hypothetical protein [Bacteroidales bacterium]
MIYHGAKKLIFTAFIFLIVSCGGGGGGDDAESPDNPSSGERLNSNVSGYLLFEYGDNGYLMDVSTGTYRKINNTDWGANNTLFPKPDSASFYVWPVQNDRTEFLLKAHDCDHSFGDSLTCIVLQDYQGNINNSFSMWDTLLGTTLSPNKQYIALFRILAADWFEIYTRSGDLVSSNRLDYTNYAWYGNRIIYASNRRFYFTEENSTVADYFLELPNNIDTSANIGRLVVSPDQQRVAFELVSEELRYSKPYIMNIDGSNIRQLADMPENSEYKNIVEPQWSPDGKWILVKQGYSAVSTPTDGTRPYLYLLPTEDTGKVYIISIVDSERSPEIKEFYRYDNIDNSGQVTNNALSETTMYWIP